MLTLAPTPPEHRDLLGEAVERFLTPPRAALTDRDTALLRQGRPVDLKSGLAATAWGDGPTVLLAHGWGSRGTHWGAFVPPLVEAGFRAVAVDAPAHGDSPGRHANALAFALGLLDAGRTLGPLAGVVGHSFGAGATGIALNRGLAARRAVYLSGPASLAALIARWGLSEGLTAAELPAFTRLIERRVGEPVAGLDVVRLAEALTAPVLVIHDRGDLEIPVAEAEAVAAAWPGARLLLTERFGHRRILIAPAVVRSAVAFLAAA
jgi:pimeloyl-ACP methyl ester carboxylesterase